MPSGLDALALLGNQIVKLVVDLEEVRQRDSGARIGSVLPDRCTIGCAVIIVDVLDKHAFMPHLACVAYGVFVLQQRTFAEVHLVFDLAPVSDDFALHGRPGKLQLCCDVSGAFAVVEKKGNVGSLGFAQMIVSRHIVVSPLCDYVSGDTGKSATVSGRAVLFRTMVRNKMHPTSRNLLFVALGMKTNTNKKTRIAPCSFRWRSRRDLNSC